MFYFRFYRYNQTQLDLSVFDWNFWSSHVGGITIICLLILLTQLEYIPARLQCTTIYLQFEPRV